MENIVRTGKSLLRALCLAEDQTNPKDTANENED